MGNKKEDFLQGELKIIFFALQVNSVKMNKKRFVDKKQ
jgi:hypothetical protein